MTSSRIRRPNFTAERTTCRAGRRARRRTGWLPEISPSWAMTPAAWRLVPSLANAAPFLVRWPGVTQSHLTGVTLCRPASAYFTVPRYGGQDGQLLARYDKNPPLRCGSPDGKPPRSKRFSRHRPYRPVVDCAGLCRLGLSICYDRAFRSSTPSGWSWEHELDDSSRLSAPFTQDH